MMRLNRSFQGASLRSFLVPILVVTGFAALLELVSVLGLLPITVPAPSEIWLDFAESPSVVFRHLGPTVGAAATGYALAALISITAAALATSFLWSRGFIYNLGVSIHAIPLIAATPLLVVWLGTGASTRVVIATLASYFPMLVGAMQGFGAVARTQDELFHVLAASRLQRLRLLVLPSSLPFLFAGFKIAAPSAVLGAIISEWTGAELGLGVLMIYSLFAFDVPKVWLSVIAACAIASIAYAFWALLEKIFIFWMSSPGLDED